MDSTEANQDPLAQQRELQEANAALRARLAQLEEENREMQRSVRATVDRVIMPLVQTLAAEVPLAQRAHVETLQKNLEDVASPFVNQLSTAFASLSPGQLEICMLIRNGLSNKEIAKLRHLAPGTVARHREHIRKKLGIQARKINLATFLRTEFGREEP